MKTCEGLGKDCDICGNSADCNAGEGLGFGEGLFIGFLVGASAIAAVAFWCVS